MNYIHPTAIIYPNVKLGDNVFIGAYSVIGAPAEWPDKVDPRSLTGHRYGVKIEDNVTIREHVTINGGYDGYTIISDSTYIMSHSHIGHDADIRSECILHSGCVIGGYSTIHTLSRIGLNATMHPHSILHKGTMIGAQAFFKGETEGEYGMYAGVPARYIGPNQRLIDKLIGV